MHSFNNIGSGRPVMPRSPGEVTQSQSLLGQLARAVLLAALAAVLSYGCDRKEESHKENRQQGRGVTLQEESASPVDFGAYHALIIGIDDYRDWPHLKFATGRISNLPRRMQLILASS
jgi:hypothetical protein